jgi:hypothetical protein
MGDIFIPWAKGAYLYQSKPWEASGEVLIPAPMGLARHPCCCSGRGASNVSSVAIFKIAIVIIPASRVAN